MKKLIAFFEIPASNFHRAVEFYESVLEVKLSVFECEYEKMACFCEDGEMVGAISYASDFCPSEHGVLIHFSCTNMEKTLEKVIAKGGEVVIPKTKIEVEGKGYFAVFADSEANHIGLYSVD
ncbi:VOC family protein [Phocaeicola sp.]